MDGRMAGWVTGGMDTGVEVWEPREERGEEKEKGMESGGQEEDRELWGEEEQKKKKKFGLVPIYHSDS